MATPDPQPRPESTASSPPSDVEAVAAAVRELATAQPGLVSAAAPLRDLTTLRVGGPAAGICRIRTRDDAQRFLEFAGARGLRWATLGGGSNVFADDVGFAGLLLRPENDECAVAGVTVTAGAGLRFDALIERTLAAGLVGLEFASGIPGSVGGAVVGNAGCHGHEIAEFLLAATLLRADGRLETIGPETLTFGYRRSALQGGRDIVLDVTFRLRRADAGPAWRERAERLALRRRKHPVTEPCAGSWFKNVEPEVAGGRRQAAGELLEQAGALALRVGDAAVYPRHANIIINAGAATSADVAALVELMRAAVASRFGIRLEEEVRRLGRTGFVPLAAPRPDGAPRTCEVPPRPAPP
jgi:UDP-N-acetylmuramate dehydrogenase